MSEELFVVVLTQTALTPRGTQSVVYGPYKTYDEATEKFNFLRKHVGDADQCLEITRLND